MRMIVRITNSLLVIILWLLFTGCISFNFLKRSHKYHLSSRLHQISLSETTSGIKDSETLKSIAQGSFNSGQVFVCTNTWCREKGSDATMAAFTFLTPEGTPVVGVNCLGRCNKGPNVRIFTPEGEFIEASMVRSVETVVDLLQTHLSLTVNYTSAEVLRLNYEGNVHLRNGNADLAIDCYNKAIEFNDKEQEGVLLVMRGTALLQRAYACRLKCRDIVAVAEEVIPTTEGINVISDSLSSLLPFLRAKVLMDMLLRVAYIFRNLDASPRWTENKQRWLDLKDNNVVVTTGEQLVDRGTFAYSLYEHSLMRALQDLLTATIVLPGFGAAWRRAGDALSEYRLFNSAIEYYEVAVKLDPSLGDVLLPCIERLRITERFIENAEAKGWPSDAILSLIEE